LTGLNKSTVSSLIGELVERGLIYEAGLDHSGGGRPATLLRLNPGAGHIIGVELGVDFVLAVLSDFTGNILWRQRVETQPGEGLETIIARTQELVDEALVVNQTLGAHLFGMGLTLPGMVDVAKGSLLYSPNLRWRDVALRPFFEDYFQRPVFLENDANAAAVGEHFFGLARQVQSFIFIVASVGIGGGLFLDGHLYRGAGGLAGEIGHANFMGESGRPCRCGNRGCWENSGNESSLRHRVRTLLEIKRESLIPGLMEAGQSPLTVSLIKQAADAGDAIALEALAETGAAIGIGISNIINIFNPELVVLGGTMSVASDYLLPAIKNQVEKHALNETRRQVEIVISAFGSEAVVIGAVALVLEDLIASPGNVGQLVEVQGGS
jgi:glucokinase-like ROK family protein